MENLDDAGAFRNTSDPATFDQCERALKQVVYSLDQLAHVWKVSARSSFLGTVGTLQQAETPGLLVAAAPIKNVLSYPRETRQRCPLSRAR
jgi:hypothetical protein